MFALCVDFEVAIEVEFKYERFIAQIAGVIAFSFVNMQMLREMAFLKCLQFENQNCKKMLQTKNLAYSIF